MDAVATEAAEDSSCSSSSEDEHATDSDDGHSCGTDDEADAVNIPSADEAELEPASVATPSTGASSSAEDITASLPVAQIAYKDKNVVPPSSETWNATYSGPYKRWYWYRRGSTVGAEWDTTWELPNEVSAYVAAHAAAAATRVATAAADVSDAATATAQVASRFHKQTYEALMHTYDTDLATHVLAVWEERGDVEMARGWIKSKDEFVERATKYVATKEKKTISDVDKIAFLARLRTPPPVTAMAAVIAEVMETPIVKVALAGRCKSAATLCDRLKSDHGGCARHLATQFNACLVTAFTEVLSTSSSSGLTDIKLVTSCTLSTFVTSTQGDATKARVSELAATAATEHDQFVLAVVARAWEQKFRQTLRGPTASKELTGPKVCVSSPCAAHMITNATLPRCRAAALPPLRCRCLNCRCVSLRQLPPLLY